MGYGMEVLIKSDITVTQPPEALLDWCEDNLVLPNPDYEKKLRLGYYVGNTPKTLSLYETHGDRIVLPYGTLHHVLPFVQNTHRVRGGFAEWATIPFLGTDVSLYPYQISAVQALYNAKFGILQSPAGSGKTQMGIALIKKFSKPALWLTHTKELLNQSRDRALRYIDPALIGTITEGKVNIGKGVTFATIQTMSNLDLSKYKDMWSVVITDEAHHAASCPTAVTRFGKVLNHLNAPYKFGLSATMHRADGLIKSVYALLGDIVYTVPDEEVSGRVMQVGVCPIGTGTLSSEDCLKPDGTLDYWGLINWLCIDRERSRLIIDTITRHREKPALILGERLDYLRDLMDMLPDELREKACLVSGKTRKLEREQSIKDMREGRKNYLFATFALAKEGLDLPRLEALYMVTPARDEAVVIQSVGRVARVCENKGQPVVFDFVDPIPYCKRAYKDRCRFYKRLGAKFAEE